MRNAGVLAVDYTLGQETLTHEQLIERFGAEAMAKVLKGSGIRSRRVAPRGVTGSDLAFDAADRLLNRYAIDRSTIDLIVHCTQSPDYFLPSTACLLQTRLGLGTACGAFDLNLGCSQYVYGLSVASSMIRAGVVRNALLTTGDTLTHALHPMDRSVVPLMGDAGSATLLGPVDEGQGVEAFELGTDGAGQEFLKIPAGGYRLPAGPDTGIEATDAEGNVRRPQDLYMNGAAIFHFAISTVPKMIRAVLARGNWTLDDIDAILFHQANQYMLDYLVKKLGIPREKTHFFLEEVGNTSGTTLPTVLTEAWRAGKVAPGKRVLLCAFGVGLSWGAVVMKWPETAFSPETSA